MPQSLRWRADNYVMVARLWRTPRPSRSGRQQVADQVRDESRRGFLALRVLGSVTVLCCLLFVPFDATSGQRLIAMGVVVGVVPLIAAAEKVIAAHRVDWAVKTLITLAAAVVALILPVLWVGCFVLITGSVVAAIAVEDRRIAFAQVAFAAVALSLVGVVHDRDWPAPAVALIVIGALADRYHQRWRGHRSETDRRYDTLVETAALVFWEVEPSSGRVVSVLGNTARLLGWGTTDLVGRDWFDLVVDRRRYDAAVRTLAEEPRDEGVFAVFDLRHRDGTEVPFRHRIMIDPSTGLVQGAAVEITELTLATKLIRHQAEHDGLTGLLNRSVLIDRLATALDTCDESSPVALLMVDLDRFKEVNDVLGHRIGDRVLAVLARRFEQLDGVAAAARLGGDEFALMCTGRAAGDAEGVAMQVVEVIEHLVQVESLSLSVSASIGVAVAPSDGVDVATLMTRADTAMYRAKNSQIRVVRFTDTHDLRLGESAALSSEFREAITTGQVELWFQPQVELESDRIVGVEGLARWRHPDLGVLTPDRFLPLLAVSGAYQAFTDEVLRQGIEFASITAQEGAAIDVSVNLNAMSFVDHGLPDRVQALLDAHGVDPQRLILEITESEILEDLSINGPVFDQLATMGVQLSIDDFGVGYSSLSRLRHLPVHELKIDRSFVRNLLSDPQDEIIVRAIVELADVLGHRSVAEGVEDPQAVDRLREMGCVLAQGFLFGRPEPASVFLDRFPTVAGARRLGRSTVVG